MPAAIFAPPATDGSIGWAWSASARQVCRTSRQGRPAKQASRMMVWLDIMIDDREWWPYRSE